jgi:penicillin-binding protein 1A
VRADFGMLERIQALNAKLLRPIPGRLAGYLRELFGQQTPPLRRVRLAALGCLLGALAGVFALLLYALALIPFTPTIDGEADAVLAARDVKPSVLLAADGTVIARFRRANQEWIALDQVPQHVIDALIATEDHRFYQHGGIDWRRAFASVFHTLGGDRQGGSTITQQLARNLFPEQVGRSATVTRKLKEMITALKIEAHYSKRQILESYLNSIPFLYNAVGLEMAARTYFDKPAAKLDLLEGATLVGMLKGTSTYNPVQNPERAQARRNVVLAQMVKHGKLPQKTYDILARRPLRIDFVRQDLDDNLAPHFAEAARRIAQAFVEPLGFDLATDGLVIQSTLDPRLQRLAEAAVARQTDALQAVADVEWSAASGRLLATRTEPYVKAHAKAKPFAHWWATHQELIDAFIRESPEYVQRLEAGARRQEALDALRADRAFLEQLRVRKTRLEAGLVAIEPASGRVRAWVGSRDFAVDRYDHVQQARRQPGSTFKPFVYGAALEAGISPARNFTASRVALRLPNGEKWRPRDSGEAGDSGDGELTLVDGLVYSRNTVAAQLVNEIGARPVADFARRAGVRTSELDAVPSLALGTSPVSLLEMVSGYATIASLGQYHTPLLVTRVTDRNGVVLARFDAAPQPAVKPEVAIELIDMMRGVVDRGTGRAVREVWGLRGDVAGKTGTTQNNSDGWFILMQPQLAVGAWVGFNDPRVTLRSDYWGQGGHNAVNLVGDFMAQAMAAGAADASAEFPRPPAADLPAVFARIGSALRRWFRFGSD